MFRVPHAKTKLYLMYFCTVQQTEETAPQRVDLAQLLPEHGRVDAKALMQECNEKYYMSKKS